MKFLDTDCTGRSGSIHDFLEPGLQMSQSGDVLKATIGERGAVVALSGSQPSEDAAQPVVVVVLGETRQCSFGSGKAFKALPVEDLRLEDVPESLDLAVGPRRADLRAQMLNSKFAELLSEQSEDAWHPDDKRLSVVAHELKRLAAQFEAFVQPSEDGRGFVLVQDAKPDNEPGMVVNKTNKPGLDVTAAPQVDEERALDVDVPEFVGPTSFVAGTGRSGHSSPTAAAGCEETIDMVGADLVDLASHHFGGNPLRVPVGVKPDGDDDQVDPCWYLLAQSMWPARTLQQSTDAFACEACDPVVKSSSSDTELFTGSVNPNFGRHPNSSHSLADPIQVGALSWVARPAILSGQEEEPGSPLVAVSTNVTAGIRSESARLLGHAGTLQPAVQYLSRNFI